MIAGTHAATRERDEAGFSLVELLVAISLFAVLGTLILSMVFATNTSAQNGRANADLTEEARLALNRIAREVREARSVDAVYPAGTGESGFTISVDFNRNGAIDPVTASTPPEDAEQLTYCYRNQQVLMQPGLVDCAAVTAYPILAAKVTSFQVTYTSSYQQNGVGLQPVLPTTAALSRIDGITLALTASGSGHTQSFRTTIDLRNR